MTTKEPFCLAILIFTSTALDAAVISSALLRVEISDENGALVVTDLRTNVAWRQAWVENDPACRQRIVAVDEAQRQLTLNCGLAGVTHEGKKAVATCHHDEAIVTSRWEDGMHQPPVYWQRKNLWCVLYGAPPMYRMFASTQEKWQEQIRQTHRYVSDWVCEIAFEAMTSHRFVTADRTVQETEFTGGSGVVVNFGDEDCRLPDGQVIKPCDYVIFRRAGDNRTYTLPPCGNVSERKTPQKSN